MQLTLDITPVNNLILNIFKFFISKHKKDAQWTCQDELIPVDINELNPMQFVVYRFGVFIIQLLQDVMEVPEVTLLIASSLPPNNYSKNAFRNSFFYERSRKILFVRQERMDSVGDFVVLMMHCLAHIKVDDLCDDNNVLFLREFYKVCFINIVSILKEMCSVKHASR